MHTITRSTSATLSRSCPYIGLRPFGEEDAEYFAGREADIRSVCASIYGPGTTVLYGPSGVGKSSILRAGVIPRLKKDRRCFTVYYNRWQRDDFEHLIKTECLVASNFDKQEDSLELPLDQLIERIQLARPGRSFFFILDQFEEYLIYHQEDDHQEGGFDDQIAITVNRPELHVHFLLATRDEALWKIDQRLRRRIPDLLANTVRLEHLKSDEAERAIRDPLSVFVKQNPGFPGPVEIEDSAVIELIRQSTPEQDPFALTEGLGRLPSEQTQTIENVLLQLLLVRLWETETKQGSKIIRRGTLLGAEVGGASSVLRSHLQRVIGTFNDVEKDICARIFQYLVTPGGTKIAQKTQDLILIAQWSSSVGTEYSRALIQGVLDKLDQNPEARILRKIDRPERYEIFHDRLAGAILSWRNQYIQQQLQEQARQQAAADAGRRAREEARERALVQAQQFANEKDTLAKQQAVLAQKLKKRNTVLYFTLAIILIFAVCLAVLLKKSITDGRKLQDNAKTLTASQERLKLEDARIRQAVKELQEEKIKREDAERAANTSEKAQSLVSEAQVALKSQYPDSAKAIRLYEQALEIAQKNSNHVLEADIYNDLEEAYFAIGQYKISIRYAQQAQQIFHSLHKRDKEAEALSHIAAAQVNLKEFAEGVKNFQKSQELWRQIDDQKQLASTLRNLAVAYAGNGEFNKSIEVFREALTALRTFRKPGELAIDLKSLASIYQLNHQPDRAVETLREALENSKAESPKDKLDILDHILEVSADSGHWEWSIPALNEMITIAEQHPDAIDKGVVLLNFGTAYAGLNRYPDAIEKVQQAISFYENGHKKERTIHAYRKLSAIYKKMGKEDEAQKALEKAKSLEGSTQPEEN